MEVLVVQVPVVVLDQAFSSTASVANLARFLSLSENRVNQKLPSRVL